MSPTGRTADVHSPPVRAVVAWTDVGTDTATVRIRVWAGDELLYAGPPTTRS
jgi:hypothetical protein